MLAPNRVALVHDWLTGMRGGERVLEVLAEIFPEADLFTLFHHRGSVSPALEALPVHTSFLQRMPFLRRAYRYYLPLYPRAVEALDLSGYDLVISSSHCVAKGVRTDPGALHICYCHTPMRYAWDRFDDYFGPGTGSRVPRPLARLVTDRLRRWDRESASRVHRFVANSRHVAGRIRAFYGRPADVVPPPVDTRRFRPTRSARAGAEFLMVSALVPYKRIDRAVQAFRGFGRGLRVVGDGPEAKRLRRSAGEEVTFLGRIDDAALAGEYRRCRALLVPGIEDAGITPLEAMASGRPVIALAQGGVPEVLTPETGLLFDDDGPAGIRRAVERFEELESGFDPASIRRHAEAYDRDRFRARLQEVLLQAAARPAEAVA